MMFFQIGEKNTPPTHLSFSLPNSIYLNQLRSDGSHQLSSSLQNLSLSHAYSGWTFFVQSLTPPFAFGFDKPDPFASFFSHSHRQ